MRIQLSKVALIASFVLALAFTFGCSSDDDEKKDNGGGDSDALAGFTFVGGCDQRNSTGAPRCLNHYSNPNYYDTFKETTKENCEKSGLWIWPPNIVYARVWRDHSYIVIKHS